MQENGPEFYHDLLNHKEIYTICNKDWYITVFDDGTIDGFIYEGDERAKIEYEAELSLIEQSMKTNSISSIIRKLKK